MLSSVSQINTNKLYFNRHKKTAFTAKQPTCTYEGSGKSENDQDKLANWQKTMVNQIHSPLDVFLTLAAFGALGGIAFYYLRNNRFRTTPFNNSNLKFISLKNDTKVPNLDTCKSINKDLREMLENQLKLSNCDHKILEEAGFPQTNKAFLMSGSPGNGKTLFSKIYAKSMDAEYMEIIVPDLLSRWVGETEENMSAVFKKILKTANQNKDKKYVVTLNEVDSTLIPVEQLFGGSGSTHFASLRKQRSLFLNYIDKIQNEANNVTIIGTTNLAPNSKLLDSASISRFQSVIEVPYPDRHCLYEALKMNLEKIKDKDIFINKNDESLKKLADTMAERKFSFRNLENMVNSAKTKFLRDKLSDKNTSFDYKYLDEAQKKLLKSDGECELLNKLQKP